MTSDVDASSSMGGARVANSIALAARSTERGRKCDVRAFERSSGRRGRTRASRDDEMHDSRLSSNATASTRTLTCAEVIGDASGAIWMRDSVGGAFTRTRPIDAKTGRERAVGVPELRAVFLPSGFPQTVSADYADWLRWHLTSLLFRDVIEIMSAQSLLVALGVGSTPGALPLTAAAKWVLKDGVGSFATLLAGAFGGRWYDEDPKRWWAVSNALEDVARAIELVTPAAPGLFLPLAASATFVRAAALTGRGSLMNGTFMQHFGRNNNLGDIRAKLEVQGRWLALVALPVGIQVFQLVNAQASALHAEGDELGAAAAAFGGYGLVIGAHIFSCWQAARSLKFDSLNGFRLLRLAEAYVASDGKIELPNCVEIGEIEGVYKPRRTLTTPTFGASPNEIGSTWDAFIEATNASNGHPYVLGFDSSRGDVASALILESATPRDMLAAALACEKLRIDRSSVVSAYDYADSQTADFEDALIRAGWKVGFVQTGTAPKFALSTT
ncbi:Vitamin B6 photo-protection and homoeostasis [Ostreococcus tauri]|uniref:Vitamin B6 photo-protection and homoeostasis n=1 Tax=Ostreococcus tauri TaxID=70448 RepID=Q017Q6_OSTTA|nr:Vitamin B6 photo-protection and homoeostasis [Ostreococcus tauri]OUS48596.1 vitamin B6 photo-protection and homoeostasis-domain-containing protein [Ostreococcus tauri]CAL53355.1 Vitamin B6 photo-protection and homoeostasis [Ostreococcus tauri]|eukprot:XP_003079709.1 Vitamin B6 photo-protection and homoeostasis [Ostreococcus tauri]